MGLLHYNMGQRDCVPAGSYPPEVEERYKRDAAKDLHEGIDLVFELKAKIDKFHPIATETLIRLLCM